MRPRADIATLAGRHRCTGKCADDRSVTRTHRNGKPRANISPGLLCHQR
jgi:hypothetical protein